ncbi:MAG: hypothetical protein HYY23_14500 [Verrucomicrobia bacterium]|nr:hypothetical protein [Verrucomicrobiota bacterium]
MLSPVVEKDINEYYKARNGTSAGVEVVVIGINTDVTSQANTDNFIRNVGFDLVLDDPDWKSYAQFGPGNSASRYVIINGLADSPSHKQWEVLFNQVYFQPRQPEVVRAIIEKVKPPPVAEPIRPVLGGVRRIDSGAVEFALSGEVGRRYHVEFSTDLRSWTRVATLTAGAEKTTHRDDRAAAAAQGFYRAVSE